MRRLSVALICCGILQAMLPTPALAWWEKIEDWSGPGPFYGWTIDGRLVCFVLRPDLKVSVPDPNDPKATITVPDPNLHTQSGGLVFSACRLPDKAKRRAWIDLGMGFLWKKDDPRFANGQRISLTTLEPSFSWQIIQKDSLDFIDYGIGAGIYWISSVAFPSVRGTFLEPVRLDFHATTDMSRDIGWWIRIPVFRAGLLVFPGGHDTTAFAARSDAARRISRDWVPTYGIFADLEPLLDHFRGITR
jgi:hypothetical protein